VDQVSLVASGVNALQAEGSRTRINNAVVLEYYEDLVPASGQIDVADKSYIEIDGVVTHFNNGVTGQVLVVLLEGGNGDAVNDTSNIDLANNANFEPTTTATLTLINLGSIWKELSRTEF
jgi:hypothetical protein